MRKRFGILEDVPTLPVNAEAKEVTSVELEEGALVYLMSSTRARCRVGLEGVPDGQETLASEGPQAFFVEYNTYPIPGADGEVSIVGLNPPTEEVIVLRPAEGFPDVVYEPLEESIEIVEVQAPDGVYIRY
jgi:hypothetical protein